MQLLHQEQFVRRMQIIDHVVLGVRDAAICVTIALHDAYCPPLVEGKSRFVT